MIDTRREIANACFHLGRGVTYAEPPMNSSIPDTVARVVIRIIMLPYAHHALCKPH